MKKLQWLIIKCILNLYFRDITFELKKYVCTIKAYVLLTLQKNLLNEEEK